MKITKGMVFPIAKNILKERWHTLGDAAVEVIANQAACKEYADTSALSKELTKLVNNQFPNRRARRQGRGRLASVDGWPSRTPSSAELDPEAVVSADQSLSEIARDAANSPSNSAVLRAQTEASDRVDHILTGVPPKQREVLERVLPDIEPSDSIREVAKKAGLHPAQVSRSFEAAKRADKVRFFKEANRRGRRPAARYTEYSPAGVSHEDVMRIHGGATIPCIGIDKRTSVGRDVHNRCAGRAIQPAQTTQPQENTNSNSVNVGAPTALTPVDSANNGCNT